MDDKVLPGNFSVKVKFRDQIKEIQTNMIDEIQVLKFKIAEAFKIPD
jgi:hypothetical protein